MGFFGSKNKRGGTIYLGESTRSNNSRKIYTGITRRPVQVRWKEHSNSVKSEKGKTWVSRGKSWRPLGAFYSRNPEKAERAIKNLPAYQKRYLARGAAMKYNKRKRFLF